MRQLDAPEANAMVMADANLASEITRRAFVSRMALLPVSLLLMPGSHQVVQGTKRAVPLGSPKGAGVLAPALSAGVPLSAEARRHAIVQVLEEAQMSRNMGGAIEKFGKSLTPADKGILLGITADELAALQSARSKLKLKASP